MFLGDLGSALRRYWYIVLIGAVVTTLLGAVTFASVSPTYTSRANVILLPPESSVGPAGNPYLYLGGLTEALDVLVRTLNADDTSRHITDDGGQYLVVRDQSTTGPIILLEATGESADESVGTLEEVLDVLPPTLDELQADLDVPESSRITAQLLTIDEDAEVSDQSRIQAAGAVVGAGLATTVLLTGLVTGLRDRHRRPRRHGRRAATPPTEEA